ncbi:MAG: response regulator [Thauera sp.]
MNRLAFIIDDSAVNIAVARLLLQRMGWTVEDFPSAIPMLERLGQIQPAFMLLDISMPDMGGEEACRRVRSNPAWEDVRIIAYTAHALEDERQRYLVSGFDDIVTKPVTLGSLAAAVGTAPPPPETAT